MSNAVPAHYLALERNMKFCLGTPNRGLFIKPNVTWAGDNNFEFEVSGLSDTGFAKDSIARHSVTRMSVEVQNATIIWKSKMQTCTTLSVAEAELVAGVECVTCMVYVMRILESIGLKVKLPMLHWTDSKGAVDLAHSWSTGVRTRHIDVKYHYLRELNEAGLVKTVHIAGKDNPVDLFTKNIGGNDFLRHSGKYVSNLPVGSKTMERLSAPGEGVGM
jgi:hypothetical protein